MFDDLINGALSLVKPIIDTAKPIVEDMGRNSQKDPNDPGENPLRDENVLGIHPLANTNVPICKGNSRICQFISCSAHNFKSDSNFANLNLVAQLMGDKKMRKALSSNPETVTQVCQEQGLSQTECKLFAKGFSLMDNFITNFEGNEEANKTTKVDEDNNNDNHVTTSTIFRGVPSRPVREREDYDMDLDESHHINDEDYTFYQSSIPRHGSRNWSSKQKIIPQPRPTTLPIKPISTTQMKIKSISFGESTSERIKIPRAQLPRGNNNKKGLTPIVPVNRPHISRREVVVNNKKNVPKKGQRKINNNLPLRVLPKKNKPTQVRPQRANKNNHRVPKSIEHFVIQLNNNIKDEIRKKRSSPEYYDDVDTSKKINNNNDSKNRGSENIYDESTDSSINQSDNSKIFKQNCLQYLG
uniref:Uncharacterized protein n=1 Tax=Parastrongyloides trichosuri TaxID=131310 RepID=A0A0N4Z419_PARTI